MLYFSFILKPQYFLKMKLFLLDINISKSIYLIHIKACLEFNGLLHLGIEIDVLRILDFLFQSHVFLLMKFAESKFHLPNFEC